MRNRSMPSIFRTGGRLLRWNRRHCVRNGKQLSALITHESCTGAVRILRERAERGHMNPRDLVVRDYSRVPR